MIVGISLHGMIQLNHLHNSQFYGEKKNKNVIDSNDGKWGIHYYRHMILDPLRITKAKGNDDIYGAL